MGQEHPSAAVPLDSEVIEYLARFFLIFNSLFIFFPYA